MDEERMLSEGEHTEGRSESGPTRETTTGASWKKVAVIGAVLLLLVAGVFLAVRSTRTEHELVVAHKKAHGGGQSSQGTSNRQDTSKRTTMLMATTAPYMTEVPITAKETTETTTIPLSANSITGFKKTAVICVYGLGLDYSITFPDNNLCDLMVYDSLYKKGRNFFDGRYGSDLLHFLNSSASMTIRNAGLSIDFRKYMVLGHLLSKDAEGHLFGPSRYIGDFWNNRIYHYGMIDITPQQRTTQAKVLDAVKVFKEFYNLLQRYAKGKNQRTLTFFGLTPLSQEWIDVIPSILRWNVLDLALATSFQIKMLPALREDVSTALGAYTQRGGRAVFSVEFTPDIFVFRGHHFLLTRKPKTCTILPQNAIIDMPGLPISLTTAHEALSKVAEEVHTPAWAVSVTAAGRWSLPMNASNQDDYKLLKQCSRLPKNMTQLGSITEVCNNPNYVRLENKDDVTGYAYSLQDGLIMTYDTSDMLRDKLCRQKANLTHIDYGIAVFDLEYEDDSDLCPSGSYSHIKMARALAEFFESKFNVASDLKDCLLGENK